MGIRESSTSADALQAARDRREAERAHWAGVNATARLRSQGRESSTEYGRALFNASAERLSVALGVLLEGLLANPHRAGKHLSAWPLLLLVPRGPRSLAMVALSVVIDSLSQRRPDKEVARAIGDALLDEVRARRVEERGTALMRLVRRRLGARKLASRQVLESLHLDPSSWDLAQRREIGMLLLELVGSATGLIELRTIKTRGVTRRMVGPTPEALAVIRANPPRPTPIRQLPLLVRPLPWDGMTGGGRPGSTEPLVRTRAGMDLSYLTAEALRPVASAANFLQSQEMVIDPWMVSQQQRAWDHNIPGLFSTTRDGAPDPPMPEAIVGPEAWRAYRRDLAAVRRDRLEGSTARRRIETSLRQAEEVAGMPVWFSHCADFRGRAYTANRYATHQGPDHEKAAVQFAAHWPCSQEGWRWLLRAAAGHWGERGRGWQQREEWGASRVPEMVAAAQDPLTHLDLWRPAKDPWQFLQCCRAIAQQMENPGAPCGVPIRFDQTCSGVGIAAALTRDRPLMWATRICGDAMPRSGDLYSTVAEDLIEALRLDLSNGIEGEQRLAEFWLSAGVDRSLTKGPVMTTIYGARFLGITEQLIAWLEERDSGLSIGQWQKGYITPAFYLTRRVELVLGKRIGSCIRLRGWVDATCRMVLRQGRPLCWTSPSGFPIQLAQQYDPRPRVQSLCRGRRRWRTVADRGDRGELSAMETSRSATANLIHSFDAAFLHAVVSACAAHEVPVLTNHDCFATTPTDATWLHRRLHEQLRTQYEPDHLAATAAEIQRQNSDLVIPSPPRAGRWTLAGIGQDPYCFS